MAKPVLKDDSWTYDNPIEHQLAQLVNFKFSFDLVDFDNWLENLENCPAKDEIIEFREELMLAMTESSDASALLVRIKSALAYLGAKRFSIRRDEALRPLAIKGDKFNHIGREEGSLTSPFHKRIREMLNKNSALKNDAILQSILETPPEVGWKWVDKKSGGIHLRYFTSDSKKTGIKDVDWKSLQDFASKERRRLKNK